MIKFFRKIRQKLLSENKFSKYLIYAIGEIFLVVIGILIALQVNNFNETKKDVKKEQIILTQLRDVYQANLIQLEQKMLMRENIVKSALKIYKAIDNPDQISRASLVKSIAEIDIDPTFNPVQSDLTNSENLRLITNQNLKQLLSNWSSDIVTLQELESIWTNQMYQQLEPFIRELGISREIANNFVNNTEHIWLLDDNKKKLEIPSGNSQNTVSKIDIIDNKELEGMASFAIIYNHSANAQSEALIIRIKQIIELIDKEID
ncbi:hypothetical protein SAMN04487989_102468 [Bizionia echini]|uniref:Uncharacterized protein n=1 Tax=Bizionia echini TaxID=649333 RepID=A0A1I5B3S8_9FLAO|nr:DUF6090 family protein [Bizionia echini]SFN69270.1 hypothetical protein SAMN04487989_102468 [Bizionia echini]